MCVRTRLALRIYLVHAVDTLEQMANTFVPCENKQATFQIPSPQWTRFKRKSHRRLRYTSISCQNLAHGGDNSAFRLSRQTCHLQ